ncbi:MAG: LytR family transcriptional regulator [Neobacillus sp.]|jgi:LCP family protein required for cell wall assembly|nr:LytR family transcriptional regulator [Neobacillus sp.]
MSIDRQTYKKSKKRRKKLWLWIMTPILIILISVSVYATYLYNKAEIVMNDSYTPIERNTARAAEVDVEMENTSILFIGVDDSSERNFSDSSRTDALLLATFNKNQKSVKLLSIPRDSYVHIPEKDIYTKINHAHAYGGVKLTLDTVEELLDIPIDYYVKMNFNAFIDVIDALDGIKVEVPYTFSEQNSNDQAGAITLKEGLQTLDGEEALALARTRKMDSDIKRGERQQEIFKAVLSKAISVQSIGKYSDVIEAVGKNMTTDLSFNQMKSFISYLQTGSGINMESLSLAGGDSYINNIYYYQLDEASLELTQETLKDHLSDSAQSASSTDISNSTSNN